MRTRFTFPRTRRLQHKLQYQAVYDARVSESRGPLKVFAIPNSLDHPRLGLSVGRAVGIAARRNRIKRLIREAFRFMQHDSPRGYDLVVNVRPHEPLILAEYQRILSALLVKLHASWMKREDH
jgi:ribonuclease P protein component